MDTLLHSVPPTLQQATTNPRLCWRVLNTHRQVWVSLWWGHCSFLLGPGAHKVLFVPSKSLFPQSSVSSVIKIHWPPKSNFLLVGGALLPPCYLPVAKLGGGNEDNGDLLQKVPCMHCCTQCPRSCNRPPSTHASTGDSWTLTGKSGSVSCGVTAPLS